MAPTRLHSSNRIGGNGWHGVDGKRSCAPPRSPTLCDQWQTLHTFGHVRQELWLSSLWPTGTPRTSSCSDIRLSTRDKCRPRMQGAALPPSIEPEPPPSLPIPMCLDHPFQKKTDKVDVVERNHPIFKGNPKELDTHFGIHWETRLPSIGQSIFSNDKSNFHRLRENIQFGIKRISSLKN